MESLGKSFKNIKTVHLKHVSLPSAQEKTFYKTPQEASYICAECGQPVPPRRYPGGYLRLTCWCVNQKKQREERRRSREIVEQARQEAQKQRRKPEYCYGWKNKNYIARARRTFEHFEAETTDTIQNQAKAEDFAEHPAGTLLIHGPSGNGKTVLADAVVNKLRENYACIHVTGPDLFDVLDKEYSDPEAYRYLMNRLEHTDVLYLEDPEKARDTKSGHRQEKYMQVFNPLYAAGKIIVITTNLALDKNLYPLDNYLGEFVVSRLCENILELKFTGKDVRREGRKWTPRTSEKPKVK